MCNDANEPVYVDSLKIILFIMDIFQLVPITAFMLGIPRFSQIILDFGVS